MKTLSKIIAVQALILIILTGAVIPAAASGKSLNIGMIFDTPRAEMEKVRKLESEISALLSAKHMVRIPESAVFWTSGNPEEIDRAYNTLLKRGDVDIIIGAGILTAARLGTKKTYPNPSILIGVFQPELQNIPITDHNTSGKKNLAYIQDKMSLKSALEKFKKLYPFKNIGIAADPRVITSLPDMARLEGMLARLGLSHSFIPVRSGMTEFGIGEYDVDAILFGGAYRISKETLGSLTREINGLKIPSFTTADMELVENGILAGIVPKNLETKITRRIALMVEKITEGTPPSELSVTIDFDEILVINMETAKAIGFNPGWDTMSRAMLINFEPFSSENVLGLKQVINMALENNLTVAGARDTLEIAEENVNLARSAYLPSLDATLASTQINDERAVGGQAENTSTGSIKVSQLIYSEPRLSDISSGKDLAEASSMDLRKEQLDLVQSTVNAYFNVLLAKTDLNVKQASMVLTRKNLEIAHVRNQVGYAGMSDVYRWESRLANETSATISAYTQVLKAKNALRNLMNLPAGAEFEIPETTLKDDFFKTYSDFDIKDMVGNHNTLDTFLSFLISDSRGHHPELASLTASISARERELASLKRTHYHPTVALSGEWADTISRNGSGTDFVPEPEDNNWSATLSATWSIYSGGSNRVNIRKALLEISRLKKNRDQVELSLVTEIKDALLDLLAKSEKVTLSKKAAEAGKKSLSLTTDAYARGSVSVVELLDAQNSSINSDLAAASAAYEYLVSIINLERKNGRYLSLANQEDRQAFLERLDTHMKKNER